MSRLKLPLAVAVFAAAAFFTASGRWPWRRFDVAAPAVIAAPIASRAPARTEIVDTLRRGETLSELFARHGVAGVDLASLGGTLNPRRLRAGLVFNFRRAAEDSAPDHITVRTSPEQRVKFRRVANGWSTEAEQIAWEPQVARIDGEINDNLYLALDAAIADAVLDEGQRAELAYKLADVFAWQVDFTRDIQKGDRFQVLFERLVSEDGEVRFGRILATDLEISDKHLTAFRFGRDGQASFYDSAGASLKRAFLRAPVEFRRISSNFSSARFHPVLGRTRKHEGTDYAASTGTPVMSAGEGVVIRAGRAGGYGNLVEIRHRSGVTTRYGHLSRIQTKAGARVSQGQQIGLVGATGLASGPHLHYEFRVNGVAKDSRKVNLGNGAPLEGRERQLFATERSKLAELLYDRAPAAIASRSN